LNVKIEPKIVGLYASIYGSFRVIPSLVFTLLKMRHKTAGVGNARHRKCEKCRICKAESTETHWHTVWSVK